MLVKQRSTTNIPGSANEIAITVEDITRGQVVVSLIRKNNVALLGPLSMKQDDSAVFQFVDKNYSLKLAQLNNALVGDDVASFVISESGSIALTEHAKIERLISIVESMDDISFVRNGTVHSAKDAADHLRQKLAAAQGRVTTALQFIDEVASASTITGKEYKIRLSDGRDISAGQFLREQLSKMESGR